jgi:hypothetical protein
VAHQAQYTGLGLLSDVDRLAPARHDVAYFGFDLAAVDSDDEHLLLLIDAQTHTPDYAHLVLLFDAHRLPLYYERFLWTVFRLQPAYGFPLRLRVVLPLDALLLPSFPLDDALLPQPPLRSLCHLPLGYCPHHSSLNVGVEPTH